MRFRKTLTLLMLAMGLVFALPAWAQQKPFTRDQVQGLVRDGLGDESGAKLIEQRGIDFAAAEDFLQSLKAAGASEAFLKALRAAKPPEPASAKKPLNQDPAIQTRQAEVQQHVARGAEFMQAKRYADAEAEYRAAIRLEPQDADLHSSLGVVLACKGDWDGEVPEEREALRLNPKDETAHLRLGAALGKNGDLDGEIREYREALRLNPDDEYGHDQLGIALWHKGDLDGEITEFREVLRLQSDNEFARYKLIKALMQKGDWDGATTEYREALRLNPNNDMAHLDLGMALGSKGDWDGMVSEEREALRLNPNNDMAHLDLGMALGSKGDWDGMISEEREALRLNPNNGLAHAALGAGLEKKADRWDALEEYRAAYMLDPKNVTYKQTYERLSQSLSPLAEATPTDISGGRREATELANPSSLVTIRAGERLPDEELSRIAAHNRALCDQTITVAGLTPNGLALYVPPEGLKFMAKNSQNYPRMCLLEDAANVLPGVPRYLLVYAYSENAFAGFQPVTRVTTTTTPVSGSGTVMSGYGDMWNFTYYGTVKTREIDTIEAPYVIQSHSLFLNAYNEGGNLVSHHSFSVSSQIGGNETSAAVYNGIELIALLWHNPSHLIKSVLKDVQKDSKKYSKN